MDLFNQDTSKINLLPYDGTVLYHGKIMSNQRADELYDFLFHQVEWKNDEAIIFGKKITTKRKVAWYGNEDYEYTYSNITRQALKWTDELLELKKKIEKLTASTYNSCLINLYHNGDEGVGWHSDDEPTLGLAPTIASVTFGAERKFVFKHKKTGQKASILLEKGSLLIMKGLTQANWLHTLPKTKKVSTARINLTFRTIYQ